MMEYDAAAKWHTIAAEKEAENGRLSDDNARLRAENAKLRAALNFIVSYERSDDPDLAHCGEIARAALQKDEGE